MIGSVSPTQIGDNHIEQHPHAEIKKKQSSGNGMSSNASLELTSLTNNTTSIDNAMQTSEDSNLTSPYHLQDSPRGSNTSTNMQSIPQEDTDYDDNDDSTTSSEGDLDMSISELLYSSSSFHAIVKPVTLTMTLAALAVIFINDEQTIAQGEQQLAEAYTVWTPSDSDGTGKTLALSLANGLVMVCVIGLMTFGIVLLYKFRCMKCLIGYMIFSSGTLLGLLGGQLFDTAIEIYGVPIDKFSFFFSIYNFCIVGVLAIFWSVGIPTYVTQGYLIATSVILAWQLAHFDEYTSWTLLFMLAIYDLCAVLTPCGPLKALVNLMSQDDSPEMPGLLYEAELPPETQRPGVPSRANSRASSGRNSTSTSRQNSSAGTSNPGNTSTASTAAVPNTAAAASSSRSEASSLPASSTMDSASEAANNAAAETTANTAATETTTNIARSTTPASEDEHVTAVIPLALARVYNLPVISWAASRTPASTPSRSRSRDTGVSTSPLLEEPTSPPVTAATAGASILLRIPENPSPAELKRDVVVQLPQNGGRIERLNRGRKRVYLERDKHGNPKRTLWVDRDGKVFAESDDDDDDSEDGKSRNSIRLGLGDFIFYSVLVGKAAMYSFTTFAACTLVILAGLGGTLVLLSVYHQALPALPISIFLAIFFYLLTRMVIEPWVEGVLHNPYYV